MADIYIKPTPASIGAATAGQGALAATALQSDDVAAVALTGSFNDLINVPINRTPTFEDRTAAAAAALINAQSVIVNRSFSENAPSVYIKVPQPANIEPASNLKFQSSDGYWFSMSAARFDMSACGATLNEAIANVVAHSSVPATMELTRDMNLTAATTVPKGWCFRVVAGRVTISAGVKLNFQGKFKAGQRQVFMGEGEVVGIKRPWVYWWGGAPDGVVECSSAMQSAIRCMEAPESGSSDGEGKFQILLGGGFHLVTNTVVFRPTLSASTGMKGCGTALGTAGGTRIVSKLSSGICLYVKATAPGSSAERICNYHFEDFVVDEAFGPSNVTVGMFIGDAETDPDDPNNGARMLDSAATLSTVKGVHIREFVVNMVWANVRKLHLSNCKLQSQSKVGKSLIITVSKAGRFTGDCIIDDNCEFEQPPNQGIPIEIIIPYTITENAEIRGVKFNTGSIYGGNRKMSIECRSSSDGSFKAGIGHIWFDGGFQFDAGNSPFPDYGVYMQAWGANGTIDEIEFNSTYFSGIGICGVYQQVFSDGTGFGKISGVTLNSPIFNYCVNELVHSEGCNAVTIDNAKIFDCGNSSSTATRYFYFNATSQWSVTGTKRIKNDPTGWPGGTITKGVQIDNGGNNYVVRGNAFLVTTPVNDNVSATNRDVATNW